MFGQNLFGKALFGSSLYGLKRISGRAEDDAPTIELKSVAQVSAEIEETARLERLEFEREAAEKLKNRPVIPSPAVVNAKINKKISDGLLEEKLKEPVELPEIDMALLAAIAEAIDD